jgi:hypothetical protein
MNRFKNNSNASRVGPDRNLANGWQFHPLASLPSYPVSHGSPSFVIFLKLCVNLPVPIDRMIF